MALVTGEGSLQSKMQPNAVTFRPLRSSAEGAHYGMGPFCVPRQTAWVWLTHASVLNFRYLAPIGTEVLPISLLSVMLTLDVR